MNMLTPTPPPHRSAHRAEAPHLSGPAGWAMLLAFLGFTVLGIVLYLVRLGDAAT